MISVDCKKKELVNGRKANAGREWRLEGNPERVDVRDFPDKDGSSDVSVGALTSGYAVKGPRLLGLCLFGPREQGTQGAPQARPDTCGRPTLDEPGG